MAPVGDAVGLVARAEVRTRWRSLLGLALLVAVVATATLSALAGARRTHSALDRFVEATQSRDARISPPVGYSAEDLEADFEGEPWVEAAAVRSLLVFSDGGGTPVFVAASSDPDFGTTVERPLVVEGRLPLPGTTNEIAVNEQAAEEGLRPGDAIDVQTFDPENFACALDRTCVLELPDSPVEQLLVTGVYRSVADLVSRESSPEAVAPTSFFDEYGARTGTFGEEVYVRLEHGADDLGRLVDFVEERGEGATGMDAEDDFLDYPQDAVDVTTRGLLVFAVISLLAGGLVVAQAISRHLAAGEERSQRLRELGATRPQQATAAALPVSVAALLGATLGAALAAPTSRWFPFGAVADIEPDPGFQLDLLSLAAGAVVLAGVAAAWAAWWGWRHSRVRHRFRAPRPSGLAHLLARVGADPALIGGARLAFERQAGHTVSTMRSALVATTIGVVGVVTFGTIVTSLDRLVAAPDQWGWNWDTAATALDPAAVETTATALAEEDGVAGSAVYRIGDIEVDDEVVSAHTLDAAEGIEHRLGEGDLPTADDEIALGALTHELLGVDIGDTVTATGPDGETEELEVVGTVVFPTFVDRDPGIGVLATSATWEQLTTRPAPPELVVRFDEGVDRAALQDELSQTHAVGFRELGLPYRLDNLDRTRSIGPALMAFFALLAFFGLVHALATAVRERRPMLTMLRLLGSRQAHVRHAVLWQALFVTGTSLLVGIPVGLAIGRWTWHRLIDDLGVISTPQVDLGQLALLIPAALGLALLGGVVPAWLAARPRIATALQPA